MNQLALPAKVIDLLEDLSTKNNLNEGDREKIIEVINYVTSRYKVVSTSMKNKLNNLTSRENTILKYVLKGKTSRQIGALLFISKHTVDTHRRNILKKLDIRNNYNCKNWLSLYELT